MPSITASSQDTLVIRELERLEIAINNGFNFQDSIFKKIGNEFYRVTLKCKDSTVEEVEMSQYDEGSLKDLLLAGLKKEMVGYKFKMKVPVSFIVPILLQNPFSKASIQKPFSDMLSNLLEHDISLIKTYWRLKLIVYKGSDNNWKREGIINCFPLTE